jgi:hypothetical protein
MQRFIGKVAHQYLNGLIGIDTLRQWANFSNRHMGRSGDWSSSKLAGALCWHLNELREGRLTEEQFRRTVIRLLQRRPRHGTC